MLRIVIDAYRLRVETDHASRDEDHGTYYPGKPIDGLVWAKGDGEFSSCAIELCICPTWGLLVQVCTDHNYSIAIDDFQRFLDLLESTDILPKWWRFEDRMECLLLAIDKDSPESIFKPIDQAELPTRYGGDTSIRVALAIIAEMVVGYDGKGPAKDDTWFREFQEFLDLHPEERARLIKPSVDMAEQILKEHGEDFSGKPSESPN